MSDIPHARKILEQLSKDLEEFNSDIMQTKAAVKAALSHMYRKKHKLIKGYKKSNSMTPELRDEILSISTDNPEMHTREIAEKLNVNQGRITEVLAGKYDKLG